MSKASQRKDTFFVQGYNDFHKGREFRWKSHPNKADYAQGWEAAKREWAADELINNPPWWRRWLAKVGIHV